MRQTDTLWHIVESLYEGGKVPSGERLTGKPLILKRKNVIMLLAVDRDDSVHLLLHPSSEKHRDQLKSLSMKDVACSVQNLLVANEPRRAYIDIFCSARRDSPLRRPFLAFCEDVLWEVDHGTAPLEECLLSVYRRWRRFWSLAAPKMPSREFVQGLWGELSVLKALISTHGARAVECWTGPISPHHDFERRGIALEVKTSLQRPPVVRIHTLGQLDETQYESLFLVAALVTSTSGGSTITDEINHVESLLGGDEEAIDEFWTKLAAAGYHPFHEVEYSSFKYVLESLAFYPVNSEFPKITEQSFRNPIDRRIHDIRYSVELAGLHHVQQDDTLVQAALTKLCSDTGA